VQAAPNPALPPGSTHRLCEPTARPGALSVAGGAERRRASIAVPSSIRSVTSAIVTVWWCTPVGLWTLRAAGDAACHRQTLAAPGCRAVSGAAGPAWPGGGRGEWLSR
jgi:hypothetical protein